MTAALIIAILALILCSATSVAVAVLVSRALTTSFKATDRMNARWAKQMDGLLDRFQAIRWEDLAALRSVDDSADAGFFTPDDEAEEQEEKDRPVWGALNALRDKLSTTQEEQELLDEDFTPDQEAVR